MKHRPFSDPAAFDSLLAAIITETSAEVKGPVRVGRVTLVGFSAGHGAIRTILARGNVVITRANYRAAGDEAVYDRVKDQIVLTGRVAEFSDGPDNVARGPRIIVNVSGDRMAVVESGDQKAVTKYKVVPPPKQLR